MGLQKGVRYTAKKTVEWYSGIRENDILEIKREVVRNTDVGELLEYEIYNHSTDRTINIYKRDLIYILDRGKMELHVGQDYMTYRLLATYDMIKVHDNLEIHEEINTDSGKWYEVYHNISKSFIRIYEDDLLYILGF